MDMNSQDSSSQLYTWKDIMNPYQKQGYAAGMGSLLDKAFSGQGFSPSQQNQMYTTGMEKINNTATGATNQALQTAAKSGIRGGALGGALGDIGEAKVGAGGDLMGNIQNLSTQKNAMDWANLMKLLTYSPMATGQNSSSFGFGLK